MTNTIKLPILRTTQFQNSPFFLCVCGGGGGKMWNALPSGHRNAATLQEFKKEPQSLNTIVGNKHDNVSQFNSIQFNLLSQNKAVHKLSKV